MQSKVLEVSSSSGSKLTSLHEWTWRCLRVSFLYDLGISEKKSNRLLQVRSFVFNIIFSSLTYQHVPKILDRTEIALNHTFVRSKSLNPGFQEYYILSLWYILSQPTKVLLKVFQSYVKSPRHTGPWMFVGLIYIFSVLVLFKKWCSVWPSMEESETFGKLSWPFQRYVSYRLSWKVPWNSLEFLGVSCNFLLSLGVSCVTLECPSNPGRL